MNALLFAVWATVGIASPPCASPHGASTGLAVLTGVMMRVPMRVEIPMTPPVGWKADERERETILTPADVGEGQLYAVMITPKEGVAGSLDALLEDGKKMTLDVGTWKAAIDPRQSKSDGGWDYKLVLGTIEAKDRTFIAQLMAMKKGDAGVVVVVLAESVETMTKYADALGAMIRETGGGKPTPTPASPGAVDLKYVVPAGWVETKVDGFPFLVKEKNEQWTKYRLSLLIFPSEALGSSVREQFDAYWKAFVTPNYTTKIVPMPLMVRLKSGYACAFDADWSAKDKRGNDVTVVIYMFAHGGRVVPVLGIYSGSDWTSDATSEVQIGEFLDSARIAGASAEKVPLFDAAKLAGEWSESSVEFATYVTRSGQYAGDATISTAAYFNLGADGAYSRTLIAIRGGARIREKDAGTWSVDDDELVLSAGGRYSLLGYGADPKVGRFLVLGNYSNAKSKLKFTNPRGILQAMWLKAK